MTTGGHVLGRPSSRQDHMTPAGDRISHRFQITALGADGRALVGMLIEVRVSGAFGAHFQARPGRVADDQRDLDTQLTLLDNARDAVNANRFRKDDLQVPGRDVAIAGLDVRRITVDGPIDNREYVCALIDNVKEMLRDRAAVKALHTDAPVASVVKL